MKQLTQLPTGTITFLFTDIEGSTRLVQRLADRYRGILELHQDILRSAFGGRGGVEFGAEGDSLFVVFSDARAAVLAALDAQRQLETYPWPQEGRVRVRMGIHTGAGVLGGGSYVGVDVHRAARIAAAGHGGQVLVSDSTRALFEHDLPDAASVRDLGTHELKDLAAPERIYQLVHPALPQEFPPLKTLTARRRQLPHQPSTFLGRDRELAEILSTFRGDGMRLVTLTGPGGIGKTRLALQAGAPLFEDFADGVFFVDLATVSHPGDVFEAIGRALDEPLTSGEPALEQLERSLRDRDVLLLLDNLEHVIDGAGGIAELLQRCPSVRILATSREALRVRGEHILVLAPLGLPADQAGSPQDLRAAPSVQLFIERAGGSAPDFELTDAALVEIAEICRRVDGLPLAIELAAARLRLFSPRELLDRLNERFDALGRGPRDLPVRQQTLRNTIEWSYGLLSEEERAVFRSLSAFASVRVDDVEDVAHHVPELATIDVIEGLMSLVDKSLVRRIEGSDGSRLEMLGTIREYAAERLRDDPLAARIERAHAEHFAALARELRDDLRGDHRAVVLNRLDDDLGNLMAAWRYWVDAGDLERLDMLLDALWVVHDVRGWYQGAVELTNGLLAVLARSSSSAEHAPEEIAAKTSLARAVMAIRGYTQDVEDAYQRALDAAGDVGDLRQRIPVLRGLGSLHLYRGEFDRCAEIGRALLHLADQEDDVGLAVEGHLRLGAALVSLGESDEGLSHLDLAADLFDPDRDAIGRFRLGPSPGVTARTTAAFVLWLRGHADEGVRCAERAIQIADLLGHPYTQAYAGFHVGLLQVWRRDWTSVLERARAVLEIAETYGYHVWKATALVMEGLALAATDRHEEGLASSDRGLGLYQGMVTPPVFWPLLLSLRAQTLAQAGRPREALEIVGLAISSAESDRPNILAPQFPLLRGDLLMAVGATEEAGAAYDIAIEIARRSGARTPELHALTRLARSRLDGEASDPILDRLRELLESDDAGFEAGDLEEAREVLAQLNG